MAEILTKRAFERAEMVLTADWGIGTSLFIDPPGGRSTVDFAALNDHVVTPMCQPPLMTEDGSLEVRFGETQLELINRSDAMIQRGVRLVIEMSVLVPEGEGILPPRCTAARMFFVDLGLPGAASANAVVLSQSCYAFGGLATGINGALTSNGVATLDVPRNVVAAWTGPAVLTVTGTDEYGAVVRESSASGTSLAGKKAFKTITSVTTSADITGLTVGHGDVLGLPVFLESVVDVLKVAANGAASSGTGVAGDRAAVADRVRDARGTIQPAATLNGATGITALVALRSAGFLNDAVGSDAAPLATMVPAQMDPPTLVEEGFNGLRMLFGLLPDDGGAPAISWYFEVTTANDPTFAAPVYTGSVADTTDVVLSSVPAQDYIARTWAENAVGFGLPSAASAPAATVQNPPSVVPVLSGADADAFSPTDAIIRVTTDTAGHTIYAMHSATLPTGQDIIDNFDYAITVLAAGDVSATISGLTPNTAYDPVRFVQSAPAGLSNVASASGFSTPAVGSEPSAGFLTLTGVSGVAAWSAPHEPEVLYLETAGSVTITAATIASPDVAPAVQTPNMDLGGGVIVNGIMKMPLFKDGQGFNRQWGSYTPAENVTLPQTLAPGEWLVFSRYAPTTNGRSGINMEYAVVIATATPPNAAHDLAPAAIGWPGRGSIMAETEALDLDGMFDLWPTKFSTVGFANPTKIPTVVDLLNKFDRLSPFLSQGTGSGAQSSTANGYQQMYPHNSGATSGNANYATEVFQTGAQSVLRAFCDDVTRANFDALMLAVCSKGKQLANTLIGDGSAIDQNGAHGMYQLPTALPYLVGVGNTTLIDDFYSSGLAGNMRQVVRLDATKAAEMNTPHRDMTKACVSRIRPIISVTPATNTIRLGIQRGGGGGDNARMKPQGMKLTLIAADDWTATTATVTAVVGDNLNKSYMDIVVDDVTGFTVGGEVAFQRPVPFAMGDLIWVIDPDTQSFFNGFKQDDYYSLQDICSTALLLGLLGIHTTSVFFDYIEFAKLTMAPVTGGVGYPSAGYAYASPVPSSNKFARDFWIAHHETLLPDTSHTATLTPILRDKAIFDSGFQRGLSHAAVPLSGTTDAPDGAVIEVRAVDVEFAGANTSAWATLDTASGGAFSGTFQAPRAPCWYRAEVRVQGSSAAASQMANRFAAGHVWSVWEQSNWAKLLEIPGSTAGLYDPITYPGDVQITARGATLGQMVPVTEANKGTAPVSPAMVTFANAWAALRGREKLLLVMQTKSGTGITDALTRDPGESPTGTRDWDEDKAIHTAATDIGTPVGAVFVPGWEEAHIGVGAAIPGNFMETFTGHNAAGVKVDLAAVWGGVPRLPVRKLADGSTTLLKSGVPFDLSDPVDGGLYDMTYSKVGYFGPHGNNLSLPVASTYPTLASLPSYDTLTEATKFAAIVDAARAAWVAANHGEVLDYPGANMGAYRALADTLHYEGSDRDGRQRHAALGLFFMTKMLGMHSYPVPALDARHDDPAGAYSDFAITGRNLTTERLRRAAAGTLGGIPATIPAIAPHRCEVMGWCIDKRPVLADIQIAAGHPVFPDGQSFCRVYANSGAPITGASEVRYGYGVWPGHLVREDYDDRVYLNWLVCDVGQPHAVLPAVPVQFQQNVGLPTTLPVTELFKVAGTTYLRSTANATPSGTRAYFEARLRVDAFSPAGMELMGLGNDAFVIVTPDGGVNLQATSGAWAIAPAGTLSLGVFRTLGFVVDRTPGAPKYEIVDPTTGAVLATQAAVPEGAFSGGRVNFFFRGGSGNALFNGTFEYARIWQNTAVPSGNPTHAVEAIAGAPHYAVPYGALQLTASGPVAPIDGVL